MTQAQSQPSIPLPDLADEAVTRRKYEWFRRQPNAPRISFEQYALAYGEKRQPSDDEMRAAYDRMCADLSRNFPGVEGEYLGVPSFEEFKTAFSGR